MARVWVLEEESAPLKLVTAWLRGSGHAVVCCRSQRSARARTVRLVCESEFLIIDVTKDRHSKIGFLLKERIPSLKIVCLSNHPMSEWSIGFSALWYSFAPGDAHILSKAFTGLEMLVMIDHLIGLEPELSHAAAG